MTNEPELADWTFEHAMAMKIRDGFDEITDAQWYVVLVANLSMMIDGLTPGEFKFSIKPVNPEIQSYFDRRLPPHHCAIELFETRH